VEFTRIEFRSCAKPSQVELAGQDRRIQYRRGLVARRISRNSRSDRSRALSRWFSLSLEDFVHRHLAGGQRTPLSPL
jgi:hypothetical protein